MGGEVEGGEGPRGSERQGSPRRLDAVIVGLGLLLIGATFAPTLGFDFVSWDDPIHVTENPLVVGGREVALKERLLTPHLGYPTPLTVMSYQVEHAIFGLDPAPYHATNVLLHLIVCLLVFAMGRRLGLGAVGAGVAMIVFGLHPMVAEPVSWVTGRKDLLAALLCLGAALEFTRRPFEVRRPRTWAALVMFVMAALSKPVSLFLAPLLFVWHLARRREGVRAALVACAPLFVFAALLFPVALVGQGATDSLRTEHGALSVLREAWYALGFHQGLLIFAHEPSVKYIPAQWPPPFDPVVDLMPLAWAAALALLVKAAPARHRPAAMVAICWAALSYLPSSSLIPLTRYLADVYLYMPLMGLGWLLGAVVERREIEGLDRRERLMMGGAALALSALLVALTLPSSARWRDSVSLWGSAYALYPGDMRLCRNTGNGYFSRKQFDLALRQYVHCAERFGPDDLEKNIAVTLASMGRGGEALDLFVEIERKRPGDPTVRRYIERLSAP